MTVLRLIEMSLAYERAAERIRNECSVAEPHQDALEDGWYDLSTSDEDLTDEIRYLESRGLIQYHPQHKTWVTLCDEGEPAVPPAAAAERKPPTTETPKFIKCPRCACISFHPQDVRNGYCGACHDFTSAAQPQGEHDGK